MHTKGEEKWVTGQLCGHYKINQTLTQTTVMYVPRNAFNLMWDHHMIQACGRIPRLSDYDDKCSYPTN